MQWTSEQAFRQGDLKHFAWFYLLIGSRCDRCASGFFGNPSDFGGSCQPCQCHHNIDTTDPEACDKETGRCLKCLYHTEGDHCQLCQHGYYGDALRQDCRSKTRIHLAGTLQRVSPSTPHPLLSLSGFCCWSTYFTGRNACSVRQNFTVNRWKMRLNFFFFKSLNPHSLSKMCLKMWLCARGHVSL